MFSQPKTWQQLHNSLLILSPLPRKNGLSDFKILVGEWAHSTVWAKFCTAIRVTILWELAESVDIYRQLKTGHRVLQCCNNWSSESVFALPSGSFGVVWRVRFVRTCRQTAWWQSYLESRGGSTMPKACKCSDEGQCPHSFPWETHEPESYEPIKKNDVKSRKLSETSVSTLHTNLCGAVSLSLRFYPRLRPGENQCWRHVNFAFEGGSYYVIFQNLPRSSRRLNPAASMKLPTCLRWSQCQNASSYRLHRGSQVRTWSCRMLQRIVWTFVGLARLGYAITTPNLWKLPE